MFASSGARKSTFMRDIGFTALIYFSGEFPAVLYSFRIIKIKLLYL